MDKIIYPIKRVNGKVLIPGDKSISHRAVMLGSISEGKTRIINFLRGEDCLSTIDCFKKLGADITENCGDIVISGKGQHSLKEHSGILYAGNSGTTVRLMTGVLSGQNFVSRITGDAAIERRPMKRIIEPMRLMNAEITARDDKFCPITIKGGNLKAIDYTLPVASAQLKSCILLAGLYAEGTTWVRETEVSRNHTELMLKGFGAKTGAQGKDCFVENSTLYGRDVEVPGDISSAAFFIVLGLLAPKGSNLLIKNVGINPTRTGILDVLKDMGANMEIHNVRGEIEPCADIYVESSALKGTKIGKEIMPRLVDEIPVLAVAAAFAEGTTEITGAEELKVKECDRIAAMTENLKAIGADVTALEDGFIINGKESLTGEGQVDSFTDHRIAMAMAVAGCLCQSSIRIKNTECIAISYPDFFETLTAVCK